MDITHFAADRPWLGKMGLAAFLFFLVKGLLWLAAPFVFLAVI